MTKQKLFLAILTCSSLILAGAAEPALAGTAKTVRKNAASGKALSPDAKPEIDVASKCESGSDGRQLAALFGKKESKEEPKENDKKKDKKKKKKDKESEPSSKEKAEESKSGETKAAETKRAEQQKPAAAQEKPVQAGEGKAQAAAKEEIPGLQPDSALISVLKDLSRALKESPDLEKVEDPCQKAAVAVARQALEKALDNPKLPSNRIITAQDKPILETTMTAESWDSGEISVSPNCHASLNAIWAKKIDGLLNLSVAGNCACKASPDGSKLGEFVFVLSGKSAMDKGFDIQSQADVNFWLGKLSNFSVDTTCCSAAEGAGLKTSSQKSTLVLKALVTERTRQYLAMENEARERQLQLAMKAEAERKQAEEAVKAEAEAKVKAEAEAKAKAEAEEKAKKEAEAKAKENTEAKTARSGEAQEKPVAVAGGGSEKTAASPSELPPPAQAADPRSHGRAEVAMAGSNLPFQPASATNRGWDSPGPGPATRMPGSSAQILLPDKAVAGQFLTAAVVNPNHAGEPLVELSFNGATLATSQDGKALYMVPDDAIPGPTLQVSMSARPELSSTAVQILQPLTVPSGPQIPRVDRVSSPVEAGGVIVIDGHSFDGVSDRNRAIIDGLHDGRVLVASPVQLKAELPRDLSPGLHSVSVSTAGPRSNPAQFEMVGFDIQISGKNAAKDQGNNKLTVRVVGTAQPVRVRIRNHTPEIMRLSKGNDVVMTTSGGSNNVVVLGVQRIQKGGYHIDARLD